MVSVGTEKAALEQRCEEGEQSSGYQEEMNQTGNIVLNILS